MDYKRWTTRLGRMVDSLRAQHVEIVRFSINPPVPEDEMARLEEYTARTNGLPSFRFDAALRGLHRVAASVELRWQRRERNAGAPLGGGMSLTPISLLYDSETGGEPWHDVWRTMDEVSAIEQVVIRFDGRTGAPSLGWRSSEGNAVSVTPLSINVDEYLDLAVAACCLSYWPLLFAEGAEPLATVHRKQLFADLRSIEPASKPEVLARRLSR